MQNEYQIILRGRISYAGTFSGNTIADAIDEAKREIRQGEIEDIEVESAIYIDPNPDE